MVCFMQYTVTSLVRELHMPGKQKHPVLGWVEEKEAGDMNRLL